MFRAIPHQRLISPLWLPIVPALSGRERHGFPKHITSLGTEGAALRFLFTRNGGF